MIRRFIAISALAAAFVLTAFIAPIATSAAPYPPSNSASLAASAHDPCAGAANMIGGSGFQAGETVQLVLARTGEIGRANVGADGTFTITVTIPLDARGSNQLRATGLTSGRSAALTLDIQCVLGQSSTRIDNHRGGLASTGVAVGGITLAAAVLLALGVALVVTGRRRRASITTR